MGKRGNRAKLTPDVQETILLHLRRGANIDVAAACAGIHRDTYFDWMKRGKTGEEPYAAFVDAVHRAMAECESLDLATILEASKSVWQAAAWRLERRYPERYGRNDRVRVEGNVEVGADRLIDKLARL